MYIDAGDVVRVRIESDEFHDDEPGPPKAHEGVQQVRESRRPPYTITVSGCRPQSTVWRANAVPSSVFDVRARARPYVLVEECGG